MHKVLIENVHDKLSKPKHSWPLNRKLNKAGGLIIKETKLGWQEHTALEQYLLANSCKLKGHPTKINKKRVYNIKANIGLTKNLS